MQQAHDPGCASLLHTCCCTRLLLLLLAPAKSTAAVST